jgi:hypothetical protein
MRLKIYVLSWLALLVGGLHAAPAGTGSPLSAPAVVLCLQPLILTPQPVLADAVESVKRLTALAQRQEGMSKRAVEALIYIFRDLFQKEHALAVAQQALEQAERQAQAKEKLAARTETVGSPLTGPNPRLAVMYRKEAADIRSAAGKRHDEALRVMKEKIAAYNMSAGYFQTQDNKAVVIALTGSLLAIVERRLPDFDFQPTVTREWIEQHRLMR